MLQMSPKAYFAFLVLLHLSVSTTGGSLYHSHDDSARNSHKLPTCLTNLHVRRLYQSSHQTGLSSESRSELPVAEHSPYFYGSLESESEASRPFLPTRTWGADQFRHFPCGSRCRLSQLWGRKSPPQPPRRHSIIKGSRSLREPHPTRFGEIPL